MNYYEETLSAIEAISKTAALVFVNITDTGKAPPEDIIIDMITALVLGFRSGLDEMKEITEEV